ncbi:MAG: sialate O-acetylesterase [Bryobacterales bacterium]
MIARLALTFLCACTLSAKDYHVYYLGGQSNMDGFGYTKDLPSDLDKPVEGVWIFHGNMAPDGVPVDGRGIWAELQPGHGTGFKSDGKTNEYSNRFGVELTFATRMKELHPDRNIALIKYSRGGTSIDERAARFFGSWEPDFTGGPREASGINQYDHFLATLRYAFAQSDIDGDGEPDRLIPAGIIWMQGESDAAATAEIAEGYEHNLKRLMDLIRAALRQDDLPVAIGRISDSGRDERDGKMWNHGDIVRAAQQAFVDSDVAAAIVTSTDGYGYSDPAHYDSAGYVDFGKRFAEALTTLE